MSLNKFYHQLFNYAKFQPVLYRTFSNKIETDIEYLPFNRSDKNARRLYVWGFAEHGALGELKVRPKRGAKYLNSHRPVRKKFAYSHQITDIACGYGFSLFSIKTEKRDKLFGCGMNTDLQIGYHDPRKNHPLGVILSMVPIRLPLKNSNTSVIKVAAGRAHSLALTDKEGVFLLGNNAYGQCARPIVSNEDYTKFREANKLPNLDGDHITDIVCGQDHSLFVSEKGEVYSCGWGADGQTGLGIYTSQWNPTKLKGDIEGECIVKIVSTTDCTLALNDKGEVFGWGNSEYNQLLLSDTITQVSTPIQLKRLNKLGKIIDIAVGGTFCLAVNEDNRVFVWGYGILGKGPEVTESMIPTEIPSTLFGCNQFNPDVKVMKVVSGVLSMMAITNFGDLYSWGQNKCGQLGLGHRDNQMFPLKVSLGGCVIKVCCGIDHTIALCKPFI